MNHATSTPTEGLIDWDAYVPRDETQAIVEAARDHFASLFTTDGLRRVQDGEDRPRLWEELAEHGYPLVGIPEDLDGLGGLVDLVALLEEAGRALVPAPLVSHAAAAQTLHRAQLLDIRLAAERLALARSRERDLLIFDGADAGVAVSTEARGDGCIVSIHALGDAPREVVPGVDRSRPWVTVPTAAIESTRHEIDLPQDDVLAAARTCVAADLVGVASRALDGGIAHALGREQFGRPIGSFQAVKHQLADAYVLLERARSLVLGSAVALGAHTRTGEASRLSRLAKAAAGDAAARCTALHTQLLGAMGLTFESDGPLAVRRARHTIPFLGNPAELYAAVAAEATGGR